MKTDHYKEKSIHYGIGHTRLRRILALAQNISGKRILDVGCATGYVGAELKKLGAYVVGTDISDKAVEIAKKQLDEAHTVEAGDILPRDFSGPYFDLILCAEVIEHVFEPVELLRLINANLNSDGVVIITTPNFMTWTNRLKFLFGKFHYTAQGMFDFGHIRFFTYEYLQEVLLASGFRIIEEQNIIFPGKLTWLLKYWPSLFAFQFIIKAEKI
jgi:2-polyprenyl-3-methyl-5-hydroxy-6-metoxy-1,4-benzoquinol methylase